HAGRDCLRGDLYSLLVERRQRVPLRAVDEGMEHGAALLPAGRVVVFRDLVEAELLVVVGADVLDRIDGPALECRVNVAGRDLLRNDPDAGNDSPRQARNAHLEALQIIRRLDLLAEPAAQLHAGIAAREANDAVLGEEGVE